MLLLPSVMPRARRSPAGACDVPSQDPGYRCQASADLLRPGAAVCLPAEHPRGSAENRVWRRAVVQHSSTPQSGTPVWKVGYGVLRLARVHATPPHQRNSPLRVIGFPAAGISMRFMFNPHAAIQSRSALRFLRGEPFHFAMMEAGGRSGIIENRFHQVRHYVSRSLSGAGPTSCGQPAKL